MVATSPAIQSSPSIPSEAISWEESRLRDRSLSAAHDAQGIAEDLAAHFNTTGRPSTTIALHCETAAEYRALHPGIWEEIGAWNEIAHPEDQAKGRSHRHSYKRMRADVLGDLASKVIVYAHYSRWGTVEESKGWEAP
jgi:hypothetical protein